MMLRILFLLALMHWPHAGPASAQQRGERDIHGIRAGGFVISPVLVIESGYDSNLFLTDGGATGTALVTLAPAVRIASDWNRHALRLETGIRAGLFSHDQSDRFFDLDLELSGEIDITRAARLSARVALRRAHEARGTDDVPGTSAKPVVFMTIDAGLRGDLRFGRFRLSPFAGYRRLDYGDVDLVGGGRGNQDDRDRTESEAGLELGYRVSRGYEAFVRAGLTATDYRAALDDTGVNRDSTELFAAAGMRLRLTRLLEGSLAVGYTHREQADATLGDSSEISTDVALIWFPTRRITVELSLARDFGETTLPGASGTLESTATLGLSYELLRTLSVRAQGSAARLEFTGAGRTDHVFDARLGFDWAATRSLTIAPEYRFGLRSSDAPNRDFMVHGFLLSATYSF